MKKLMRLYLEFRRSLASTLSLSEHLLSIDFDNLLSLYRLDINYQDSEGDTLLHLAVKDGCFNAVQFFIDKRYQC